MAHLPGGHGRGAAAAPGAPGRPRWRRRGAQDAAPGAEPRLRQGTHRAARPAATFAGGATQDVGRGDGKPLENYGKWWEVGLISNSFFKFPMLDRLLLLVVFGCFWWFL